MAGHAQLKFVMTECSKTQIRLTRLIYGRLFFSGATETLTMTSIIRPTLLETQMCLIMLHVYQISTGELMSATGAVFYLNTPYDLDAIGNVEQTDSRSLESVTVDGE